jgi:hypothetical protein
MKDDKPIFSVIKRTCMDLFSGMSTQERLPWAFFCFTCFQLAFLNPYVLIIPGERTNLFSAILCLGTLVAAWRVTAGGAINLRSPEAAVSVVLTLLAVLSSAFSSVPASSSARGFAVIASALGGFWCARIMLASQPARRFFRLYSTALLVGLLVVSFFGYAVYGAVCKLVEVNPHPLADRILILWFAPLSLFVRGSSRGRAVASVIILLSCVIFYLSDLRSAMLIPVALVLLAALFGALRARFLVLILLVIAAVLVPFFKKLPEVKTDKRMESTYYRAESYPFAWHVAKKHPFLGIGLRAPKDRFLDGYDVSYPYVTKEKFSQSVKRLTTLENTFLTFMAELGFPFFIIYTGSLVLLLGRLVRAVRRPPPAGLFHPLVLLLPIVAALLHFQVLDGLLHPQISWFFHLLLGLIPTGRSEGEDAGTSRPTRLNT